MAIQESDTNTFGEFHEFTPSEPSNEAEQGTGGADMESYSLGRVDKLSKLITTSYSNESSYQIEKAVIDPNARPFDTRWYDEEMFPVEPGQTAKQGTGGDDMSSWSDGRVDKISALITTTYSNGSSYQIEKAVVDPNARPFDRRWYSQEEYFSQLDAGAENGEGGDVMESWSDPRNGQFNNLVSTTYENNSDFEIGLGVTGSIPRPFNSGWEEGDTGNGIRVEGSATDDEGLPLSGDAQIVTGGNIIGEATSSGPITVTAPPPSGVYFGSTGESSSVDFVFSPSVDGINYVQENIGLKPSTVTVQYGRINGTVEDVEGNPVSDIQVQSSGAAASTDSEGYYEFLCPAGVQTSLLSLKRSFAKDIEIDPEETEEVNWQFPGIRVRVYGPDLEPIENSPVYIGDSSYRTDSKGEVLITQALMAEYQIVVMDHFETYIDLEEEGRLYRTQLGSGSSDFTDPDTGNPADDIPGVRVKAKDSYDQSSISKADVVIPASGVVTYTNSEGRATVLSPESGEQGGVIRVSICRGDDRYKSSSYVIDADADQDEPADVAVERKTQTVNM